MSLSQEINKFKELVNNENDFILISHVSPDGDNIGSIVALALGLQQLGKKVVAVNTDPTPSKYRYLTDFFPIFERGTLENLQGVLITLDTTDMARTGLEEALTYPKIINIDHHISNSQFGDINIVDTEAAATGEIVFKLLEHLQVAITRDIATGLYTALMTDTGSFRFSNTTSYTHNTAAALLEAGADLELINSQIYETVSLSSLKFTAAALNKLQINQQGTVGWIELDDSLFEKFAVNYDEGEGLVNYVKSVSGVEVAFILKELKEREIKISFRSKGLVDVNQIAAKFGGGGHKKAAGCHIINYQSKEKVLQSILERINQYL
ncbi:MAG: bifunctional oligoribonuclease/PAP phosphatase NrnA [Bacillota bacterium]|nr:bifunctional oligoribonuclease/PAP phosphatase NrnA [Bacillota bacterium]